VGRRTSLASLAESKVEEVPGHSAPTLVRLRPAQIAATPLNPRHSFGTEEELAELGESIRVRQLQPVVVVSRAAYLKLWPEHHEQIGDAAYILVNGERRYRAALHTKVERLDALHREEVADSRAAFLDALLTENLDRKNFDPIEEAHAVEAMVVECGSATAAAAQFRRHKAWVSQRRALLKLAPHLQDKVRSGELPVRIARSIANLAHDKQEAAWQGVRDQEAAAARQRGQQRADEPSRRSNEVPGPRPELTTKALPSGAEKGAFSPAPSHQPSSAKPGQSAPQAQSVAALPWDSPESLATLIRQHLAPEGIIRLVDLLRG
jgi:ParB family chromosome partitioning protein